MAAALAAVVATAYAPAFLGAFVFDDVPAIAENPTLKPGAGLRAALQPPAFSTVTGRPLLNLSFAANVAVAGTAPRGFHIANVLIHLAAGGLLFGVLRRTLRRCGMMEPCLVWTITAWWLLHPLDTAAVAYVVQRAESLMALFYLGACYTFARCVDADDSPVWAALTLLVALAGMAVKETMATLPCVLLLYDRCFVTGSFALALRRRPWFYAGLAATWVPLVYLMAGTHGRGGSVGFDSPMEPLAYAGTQIYAVVHYLRLAFFPAPLVFDYGTALARVDGSWCGHAVVYTALLGLTLVALVRRPRLGFLGAAFFLVLAPTSTVVPVASQTIAEHRMYLPLVAPLVLAALGLRALCGRHALLPVVIFVGALAAATGARSRVYRSPAALWTDTVAKRPANARAHDWLGTAALQAQRPEAALAEFRRAVELEPQTAKFHNNLGAALASRGDFDAAAIEFEAALRLDPQSSDARHNLGRAETQRAVALIKSGRVAEAVPHLRRAVELDPTDTAAVYNLAFTLRELGQGREMR